MPFWFIRDQVADISISAVLAVLISCNDSIFRLFGFVLLVRRAESLYRALVICPLSRSSYGTFVYGVSLLFAYLFLALIALITLSHAIIMQYLHIVRKFSSAQFTQHRRAVLIVPCSLFACCFFVAMTNNGPIAVMGDTVLQTWYSSPFTTYTTIQFSILASSETVRKFQTGCLTCSPFE